jgi:predicted dehydrogenase
MTSCVLRFPENRLASFTTSFGAEASGSFEIVGTKGRIRLDSAYDYSEDMIQEVVQGEKKKKKNFGRSDQFGPELIYFSDCVIKNKEPEPNGAEGLIDVKIIQALLESLEKGRPVKLDVPDKMDWPTLGQEIRRSKVSEVDKVNAQSASDPN